MARYDARVKAIEKRMPCPEALPELWAIREDGLLEGPGGMILTRDEYERREATTILDDIGVTP